jgi:hypothetical protein
VNNERIFPFLVKATCSQEIELARSKREMGISLLFGAKRTKKRDFPWAGAFFHNEVFYCGGSLSKFFFSN